MRFNCLRCDAEFIKSNLDWRHKCVCGLILKINQNKIDGWEINLGKYLIFTLFLWDKNHRTIRIENALPYPKFNNNHSRCLIETQYISPKFLSEDKIEKILLLG